MFVSGLLKGCEFFVFCVKAKKSKVEEAVADAVHNIRFERWCPDEEIQRMKDTNMRIVEASYDAITVNTYYDQLNVIHDNRITSSSSRKWFQGNMPITHINVPLTPQNDSALAMNEIVNNLRHALDFVKRQGKLQIWIGGCIGEMKEGKDGEPSDELAHSFIYHPGHNTNILPSDSVTGQKFLTLASKSETIEKFKSIAPSIDLEGAMLYDRPDTKSFFQFFTNVRFVIYHILNPLVGYELNSENDFAKAITVVPKVPDFVKAKRFLKGTSNRQNTNNQTSSQGTEKLCVFYAIRDALKRTDNVINLVEEFVEYRLQYGMTKPTVQQIQEKGLSLLHWGEGMVSENWCKCTLNSVIGQLEMCFGLNINVFYLDTQQMEYFEQQEREGRVPQGRSRDKVYLIPFHICLKHGPKTLDLLLDGVDEENCHAYTITNLSAFVDTYRCSDCDQTFKRKDKCTAHIQAGNCTERFKWKGGPFNRSKFLWEELRDLDIDYSNVINEGQSVPDNADCITFDIETKSVSIDGSDKYVESEQIPMSISYSFNGQKAIHIRNETNPKEMLEQAYADWVMFQEESERKWHERMNGVYMQLEEKIIEHGGCVIVPEHRFDELSNMHKAALKYNSYKKRTEAERDKVYSTFKHILTSKYEENINPNCCPPECLEAKKRYDFLFLLDYTWYAREITKDFTDEFNCNDLASTLAVETVDFSSPNALDEIHAMYRLILNDEQYNTLLKKLETKFPPTKQTGPVKLKEPSGSLMFVDMQHVLEYAEENLPVDMYMKFINETLPNTETIDFETCNQTEENRALNDNDNETNVINDITDEMFIEDMLNGGQGDGIADRGESTGENDDVNSAHDESVTTSTTKKEPHSEREIHLKHLTRVLHKLKSYGASLPILGYNSSKFDLPAYVKEWPETFNMIGNDWKSTNRQKMNENNIPITIEKTLQKDGEEISTYSVHKGYNVFKCKKDMVYFKPNIINPCGKFVHVMTPQGLCFRDLLLFVSPNTSLDRLGKSYNVSVSKMVFPYKVLGNLNLDQAQPSYSSECYEWFSDTLKKPWHKKKSNLLENEWNNFTMLYYTNLFKRFVKVQPALQVKGLNPFGFSVEQMEQLEAEYDKVLWKEDIDVSFLIGEKTSRLMKERITKWARERYEALRVNNEDADEWMCSEVEDYANYYDDNITSVYKEFWDDDDDDDENNVVVKGPEKTNIDELSSMESNGSLAFPNELRSDIKEFLRDPMLNKQKAWTTEDIFVSSDRKFKTGIEKYHEFFMHEYKQNQCQNMGEYLEIYNNVDVEIMHPIINKMKTKWSLLDSDITLFRDTVSLPNVARKFGFKKAAESGGTFHLPKGENEGHKIERTLRRNLTGGPSIIYTRQMKRNQTKLKNGKYVNRILTWDGISLYPFGMLQYMPCGETVHLYEPNEEGEWVYREVGRSQDSVGEKLWIEKCKEKHGFICSKSDVFGKALRVGPYIVDGIKHISGTENTLSDYVKAKGKKGIVYEYLGDYFHGNPQLIDKYATEENDNKVKDLVTKLYNTLSKMLYLIREGYIVICSWEKAFRQGKCMDRHQEFTHYPPFTAKYIKARIQKKDIINSVSDPDSLTDLLLEGYDRRKEAKEMTITDINFFGFVEVDLEPPESIEKFEDFEPLFVKGEREGVNSLFPALGPVQKVCIGTPYLRLCLSLGYRILKVYKALEYTPLKCLKGFVDQVVALRREGDTGNGDPLLTEVAKLVLNSFYGSSLLNKDKHGETIFVKHPFDVCKEVNKRTFISADMHSPELYQVTKTKGLIEQNIPIQVGKMVLDYAKLHMVHFYYSILKTFLEPGSFALGSMDTDSFTFGITENSLDECVKWELRDIWFNKVKKVWFAFCSDGCDHRSCNKRTPGPFKLEFEGSDFCGLSSKLYTCSPLDIGVPGKVASKGLRKSAMAPEPLKFFERALKSSQNPNPQPMSVDYSSLVMYTKDKKTVGALHKGYKCMTKQNLTRTVTDKYSKRIVTDDDVFTSPKISCIRCGTPDKQKHVREIRRKKKKIKSAAQNIPS